MIWSTAALSVALRLSVKLVPEAMSTFDVLVNVQVEPPSPVKVNLLATMSLAAPLRDRNPVPVTTSAPVLALYVALLMVGTATLLTVMPLPVVSAKTTAGSAPAAQSSAAARLYVVPPVEEVPFLLMIWSMAARSVALRFSVKLVL